MIWQPKLHTYARWSIESRATVCFRIVRWYASIALEGRALWRLGKLLVLRQSHVSAELDQDRLHCELPLPLCQAWQLGCIDLYCVSSYFTAACGSLYLSILRIHARQVNFGCELDLRRLIRVVRTAMDRNTVDAVLVDALYVQASACSRRICMRKTYVRRAEDRAVPI